MGLVLVTVYLILLLLLLLLLLLVLLLLVLLLLCGQGAVVLRLPVLVALCVLLRDVLDHPQHRQQRAHQRFRTIPD